VRATGRRFDPPPTREEVAELVYRPRPDDPRVVLELAPDAAWVVESTPHEAAVPLTRGRWKGGWRLTLAVSEVTWLERLLLVLGPAARVVQPAALKDLAASAAERLRSRYREDRS
jgi:proteasome accessory factor C